MPKRGDRGWDGSPPPYGRVALTDDGLRAVLRQRPRRVQLCRRTSGGRRPCIHPHARQPHKTLLIGQKEEHFLIAGCADSRTADLSSTERHAIHLVCQSGSDRP